MPARAAGLAPAWADRARSGGRNPPARPPPQSTLRQTRSTRSTPKTTYATPPTWASGTCAGTRPIDVPTQPELSRGMSRIVAPVARLRRRACSMPSTARGLERVERGAGVTWASVCLVSIAVALPSCNAQDATTESSGISPAVRRCRQARCDEVRVFHEPIGAELACNHARGSLVGLDATAPANLAFRAPLPERPAHVRSAASRCVRERVLPHVPCRPERRGEESLGHGAAALDGAHGIIRARRAVRAG